MAENSHGTENKKVPPPPPASGSLPAGEAALNFSADAWLAAIVESSDDAIISKNLNGIITSWNRAAERILGYRANEAIGQSVTLLIPVALREQELEILARLRNGERIDHFETVRLRKDGVGIDVSLTISPIKNDAGIVVGASKILRDISERKRVERELERLSFVLNHSGWAVAIISSVDNRIEFCNGAFAEMHGYTADELNGVEFSRLLDPDWLPNWPEQHEKMKHAADHVYESTHIRRDGSRFPVRTQTTGFRSENDKPVFRASVFEDISERKRLEAALRNREEHFRSTISQVKDYAIFTTDPRGIISTWNEGCRKVLGYDEAEFIGMNSKRLFVPEDVRSDVPDRELESAANEGAASDDRWMLRKDGRRFWCSGITTGVRDESGNVTGFTKVMRDLTDQQQIEQALRQSEALKSAILNSGLDAIVSIDHERKIIEFNAAAERMFGYSREQAMGRLVEDLIVPPSLREAHIHGVTRYLASGESHILGRRVELSAMRSDSSEFPCELTIIRVPLEGPPRFTAFIRDITQRKRRETTLRESEERYRTLFESIDEGFCILEMIFDAQNRPVDYRFLEVNPAFERQTGLAEAGGKRMRELAPLHEQHWFDIYGKIALTGESARFQSHAEQLQRSYDVFAFRFGEPAKRQVAVLFNDVTERLQIEKKLEETRAQLSQRAADLEQAVARRTADLRGTIAELEGVSYSLSHDMRAPLRTIRSFIEIALAESGDKLDAQSTELLRKSISAAGRLDRLIQDVLTYSRVSRETISLDRVNLEMLVRQIIDERPELQSPRAEITLASPLQPVRGHEAYLTQCITNLLDNAVKFVPPGQLPRVRVWSESRDHQVRVYFEDNGIGIPHDSLGRIFGIFERLHNQKIYPGTGIGLAIVRKAVERMNGSLGVESTPGRGSRFWVQLPSGD